MPIMQEFHPHNRKGRPKPYNHVRKLPFKLFTTESARTRCELNHDQTPERLRERGGLGVQEAACILQNLSWRDRPDVPEAIAFLEQLGSRTV